MRDRYQGFLSCDHLIEGLVELSAVDRKRALQLMERMATATQIDALVAIQLNAGPLLRDALQGDEDEQHLARRINSILVTNHRPDLLSLETEAT